MSPREPPSSIRDVRVMRYESTVHCRPATPACRLRAIAGSATFTTVPSRNAIPEPRAVAPITHRALAVPIRTVRAAALGATSVLLGLVGVLRPAIRSMDGPLVRIGDHADRPVDLQHRGLHLPQIRESVGADRRQQLVAVDALAPEAVGEHPAIVDEDRRAADDQALDA